MGTTQFTTSYMDKAVFDLEEVLTTAVEDLTPRFDDFDTLVGTGFSGGIVIPALALRLGKTFVLIRKETDDSHHGHGRLLGELGDRWIFVDDFCQSGRTKNRVIEKVNHAARENRHVTTYVGNYYYQSWQDRYEEVEPIKSSAPEARSVREQEFYESTIGRRGSFSFFDEAVRLTDEQIEKVGDSGRFVEYTMLNDTVFAREDQLVFEPEDIEPFSLRDTAPTIYKKSSSTTPSPKELFGVIRTSSGRVASPRSEALAPWEIELLNGLKQ